LPKILFFDCQKVQLFKVLSNFKSIFLSQPPVFVISSVFRQKTKSFEAYSIASIVSELLTLITTTWHYRILLLL